MLYTSLSATIHVLSATCAKRQFSSVCFLDRLSRNFNCSDLPASRKVSGLRGYTSNRWFCPNCNAFLSDLTHPDGFDLRSKVFVLPGRIWSNFPLQITMPATRGVILNMCSSLTNVRLKKNAPKSQRSVVSGGHLWISFRDVSLHPMTLATTCTRHFSVSRCF